MVGGGLGTWSALGEHSHTRRPVHGAAHTLCTKVQGKREVRSEAWAQGGRSQDQWSQDRTLHQVKFPAGKSLAS